MGFQYYSTHGAALAGIYGCHMICVCYMYILRMHSDISWFSSFNAV